ncbi:MAG: hypothetical protein MI749_13070 [Desulfovibrionales bacterium]|nr:hypothetical protein [Desulfovibrionales bacterium]
MPNVILPHVHIIHARRTFTTEDAKFAMFVARSLVGSTVMLWSRNSMQGHIRTVYEDLKKTSTTEKIQIDDILGVYLGVSFTGPLGTWGCVRFCNIDDLVPITNKYPFQKGDVQSMLGEPLVEDVVGLWAVYHQGGIYLSKEGVADIACRGGVLDKVEADILFGELESDDLPFSCSLIAAPPRSELIKNLCGLFAAHKVHGGPVFVDAPQLGLGPQGGASPSVLFEGGNEATANPSYDYADRIIQPVSAKRKPFNEARYDKLLHTVCESGKSKYALPFANPTIYEPVDFHGKTASEIIKDWLFEYESGPTFTSATGIQQARYINVHELKGTYSIQKRMRISVRFRDDDKRNTASAPLVDLRIQASSYGDPP